MKGRANYDCYFDKGAGVNLVVIEQVERAFQEGVETCRAAVKEITPHVGTACHKEFACGWNAAMRAVCEALGIEED